MPNVFYEQTFDLLLDKIGELSSVLSKQKAKNGETESYKFYENILKVMKLTWNTFLDFRQAYTQLEHLKFENEFLKSRCRELDNELTKYKVVENLKLTDELDNVCAHVDKYLEKLNYVNMRKNESGRH